MMQQLSLSKLLKNNYEERRKDFDEKFEDKRRKIERVMILAPGVSRLLKFT